MKIFDRKFSPEFIEKLKRAIEKDFRNFPTKYTLSLWNNDKEIVIKLKKSLFEKKVKNTEEDQKMFGHFYVSIEFGNFGPRVCLRESIESLKFFYNKKDIEFISTPSNKIKESKALVDAFTLFIEKSIKENSIKEESIKEESIKEKPIAGTEESEPKNNRQKSNEPKNNERKNNESQEKSPNSSKDKVFISYNRKFISSEKKIYDDSLREYQIDDKLTLKLFGGNVYIDTKYFFMHHAHFTEIFMAYKTAEKTIKEEYPSILDRVVNWFKK